MAEINFSINQKIEIIEDNFTYKSNIQDVRDDCILIDIPISGSKYYTMHKNSKIEFFITNENEICKCHSKVLGSRRDGNIYLIVLSYPTVINRVQRREYFRLSLSIMVKYYALKDYEAKYSLKAIFNTDIMDKLQDTYTVDLSGGGTRIITKENYPRGTKILLTMDLPEKIIIISSVVRSDLIEDDHNYRMALKFDVLSETDRDRIIRFVFLKHREQAKLLKKE